MSGKPDYLKLEKDFDRIITAQIDDRFLRPQRKKAPGNILKILEEKIDETVEAHKRNTITDILPGLFILKLEIRESGRLYLDAYEAAEQAGYEAGKNRLTVMITASLNAVGDEKVVNLFHEKERKFERAFARAVKVDGMIKNLEDIRETVEKIDTGIPPDEDTALSFLRELSLMKAGLHKAEAMYAEFGSEKYIGKILRILRTAINKTSREIADKGKNASGYIMKQANSVFQDYKATSVHVFNVGDFVRQREAMERYCKLFGELSDENREKQLRSYMDSIDETISGLKDKIEKQKRREARLSEKTGREIDEAYARFLEIKQNFADGKITKRGQRGKALKTLNQCGKILRSNGMRQKARDIDRFINSTNLDAEKTGAVEPEHNDHFYKSAFYILMPVTIGLVVLCVYFALFSRGP